MGKVNTKGRRTAPSADNSFHFPNPPYTTNESSLQSRDLSSRPMNGLGAGRKSFVEGIDSNVNGNGQQRFCQSSG